MTIHNDGPELGGDADASGAADVGAALANATALHDKLSQAVSLAGGSQAPGSTDAGTDTGVVADRLAASVVRPLSDALAALTGTSPQPVVDGPPPQSDAQRGDERRWEESLWNLARQVTALAVRPGAPTQVAEAAAALQDLVWRVSPAEDPDGWDARLVELNQLQTQAAPMIRVAMNGPYLLTGVARMTNWLGEDMAVRPQMALCRCGASAINPLCDGTHAGIGFAAARDPGRVADRRDTYVGQQVSVLDNRGTCQHSGYCADRLATVFHLGAKPFVTPSGGRMDEIIRAVRDCPSGALSYAIDGREAREQVDYDSHREPRIEVSKDGPYRVVGGIALVDGDGNDEVRNDGASLEHYALCRCGHSQNKPFCSGMHWHVDFHAPGSLPRR